MDGVGAVPADRERKALVRATFNAAAPLFDAAPLFFWDRLGRRTVYSLGLTRGDRVLDVCCGTGASALTAAALVGPAGHVVAVDLAEGLLRQARAKALGGRLTNVSVVRGDLEALPVADESVDAAVCVLGLYFAADIPATVAGLWRTVRPGGTVSVTTWGDRALEPLNSVFFEAVAEGYPPLDARGATLTWTRINTADRIRAVFAAAEAGRPVVLGERVVHRVTADDCWTVVLGSGYRLLLDLMSAAAAEDVRQAFFRRLRALPVRSLTADVLYARARKDVGTPALPVVSSA